MANFLAIFKQNIELRERIPRERIPRERWKGVHFIDLGESIPTQIYLQNLASIQPSMLSAYRSPRFLNEFTRHQQPLVI